MARGGINRVHVEKAVTELRRRGESTSIAAIRAALGNTGSLTTIQRLMQEIRADEEADQAQLSAIPLSTKLTELVGQLAVELQTAAEARLVTASAQHAEEGAEWRSGR